MKFLIRVSIISVSLWGGLFAGNSQSNALLIDSQNRILTAGLANNIFGNSQIIGLPQNAPDGTTDFALARYLSTGQLDTTFNPNGIMPGTLMINLQDLVSSNSTLVLTPLDEAITSLAFTADNKIIAAGVASAGLNSAFAIVKLNEDGSRDTTFNAAGTLGEIPGVALISFGILQDIATDVAVDSQGRIIVVGSSDNGQNIDLVVVRLTPNGQLDRTFNPLSPETGSPEFVTDITTIGADQVLFRSPGVLILRDIDGIEMLTNQGDQAATSVVVTQDDKIIVGGSLDNVDFAVDVPVLSSDFLIVKLNEDGTLDQAFNGQSTTPGIVTLDFNLLDDFSFDLKVDTNDRIVIAGLTNSADLTSFALARYTANGTLDTTFNGTGQSEGSPGTVITTISSVVNDIEIQNFLSEAHAVAIQPDNKIIATGLTDNLNDRSFVTVRYNEDGSLDGTFNRLGTTPGVLITTVEPSENTLNDTAITAENAGLDVVLGTNNTLYVTGFSNDGVQNNFTTISYLETGEFNQTFNPVGEVSNQPGIVITPFGEARSSLGNGVPIEVTEDLSRVSPSIIEELTYPPLPFTPFVLDTSIEAFSFAHRVLAGRASPNSVISVLVNDVEAISVMASKSGDWYVTLPFLADGTYQVSVLATDPITGVSLASVPVSLTVTSDSLPLPVIMTPKADRPVRTDPVIFTGTAEPGVRVNLTIDGTEHLVAQADQQGTWSAQHMLADGPHTVMAQVANSIGQVSGQSAPVKFEVFAQGSVTPRITSPKPGEMVANSTIYLTGTGRPLSELTVTLNDDAKTVKVDKNGQWSLPLVDPSGLYTAQVSQHGRASEKVRFTVVHGTKLTDTGQGTGKLSGVALPGSSIEIYSGARHLGTVQADQTGSWSYLPKGFSGGQQVSLVYKDKNGKVSKTVEKYVVL